MEKLFSVKKPIIGMIHLAGDNSKERVRRALDELVIYDEEGVNGVIIEDYHGTFQDVFETLSQSSNQDFKIVKGINILRNPYSAFKLASRFKVKFIQFDSIQTKNLDLKFYEEHRKEYPDIVVLGGVGFKYTSPTGNPLNIDLEEGRSKCEAIVTTGSGTGMETPLNKLREYKRLLNDFPLIVGAGVNLDNVYDQLSITDGAIIGSYFKPGGDTNLPVDRKKVKTLMEVVKGIREDHKNIN